MKRAKVFLIALFVTLLVITQVAVVSAGSSFDKADFISGTLDQITLATDPSTGITTVEVILTDVQGETHTIVVSEQTANDLNLLWYDEDGNPQLVETLPTSLEIPVSDILPTEEAAHHPVGNALAAFFQDIPGVDYDVIMAAHADGYGFGVIAQALWLTQKMDGDADSLAAILVAKKTGDFSAFTLEDGTVPSNWGQFKKAIMSKGKKDNLGAVMSGMDNENGNSGNPGNEGNHGNGNNNGQGNNKDKDKNDNNGNNSNRDNHGNNRP